MIYAKKGEGLGSLGVVLLTGAILMAVFFCAGQVSADTGNSCRTCHSDPVFSTFNKRIRNYYMMWEDSAHNINGVTCSDCHGGHPEQLDKKKAHGLQGNSIYMTDIAQRCGNCHDAVFDSYKKSYHYAYFKDPEIPHMDSVTCLTCHTWRNTLMGAGPNPEDVEKACELCHNYKTGKSPDIPEKAMALLIKLNKVKQQFNYLAMKTEVKPNQDVIDSSRKSVDEILAAWHSFDLKSALLKTDEVFEILKKEKQRLRMLNREKVAENLSSKSMR